MFDIISQKTIFDKFLFCFRYLFFLFFAYIDFSNFYKNNPYYFVAKLIFDKVFNFAIKSNFYIL